MNDADRKEHLTRFWSEVWNERCISASGSFLSEDVVLHISGADLQGRALLDAAMPSQWFDPFPDLHVTIEQQIAEGDRVAEALTFTGTHSGTDFHPGLLRASGRPPIPARGLPFEFTQTSICRFSGDRVTEMWEDFDRVRLFLQLGVELVVPST